jgi:penicillin amidase
LKKTPIDELGEEGFTQFLATHIMKQLIATQIVNESRHGGIMLKLKHRKESRSEILSKSFKETIAVLENQLGKSVAWTWNKVHVVEYEHALGKVALLRRIFNVGPFEVSGSNGDQQPDV